MFDLGDLGRLSPRDLLKITHVFVTHTHMDHFIGFDTLLRVSLGREKEIHLFGPPAFFTRVEGRIAGYTWNLVNEYQNNFRLKVTEVHQDRTLTRVYSCKDRFRSREMEIEEPFAGILLKEPSFHVEAVLLDHRVPCLGFSLVESYYVNIIKEGLKALDLPVGPWLDRFKKSLYSNMDPMSDFMVTWEASGKAVKEKKFVLGDLTKKIARFSPGKKITYITDIIGSPENYEKILTLTKQADNLFIEAAFLDSDKDVARRKYHLTARQAGELARKSGVKQLTLFHFSPRYSHRSEEIKKEAMEAFGSLV